MSFDKEGKMQQLQGIKAAELDVLYSNQFQKKANKIGKGIMLQLIYLHTMQEGDATNDWLQSFLTEFADVFEEPKSLPPKRKQDHHVSVVGGYKPVIVRPYRYPPYQKNDLEKLIIRDAQM